MAFELKRNAIAKDLFVFGIPALVVFVIGLSVSARDGYDGLLAELWRLLREPQNVQNLSLSNTLGLMTCVVGFTLMFVALGTLRQNYSSSLVVREEHQLVTHGIYRYVRHPIYLGAILVICVAVPLYATSLYGFLVLSLLIPIVLNRIRLEEGLLREEFGEAFDKYAASTSKLIPFIY